MPQLHSIESCFCNDVGLDTRLGSGVVLLPSVCTQSSVEHEREPSSMVRTFHDGFIVVCVHLRVVVAAIVSFVVSLF